MQGTYEVRSVLKNRNLLFRLMAYLTPYKWKVITAVILLFILSVLQLAGPYLVKLAIDGPIASGDGDGLMVLCLIYAATVVGSFILMFAQIYLMNWTGQYVMYDLRMKLFRHIQQLTLRYFDTTPVGWLMTRLTSDIQTLNDLLSSGIVQIIGDLLTLLGILAVLLTLNMPLASVTMISLMILVTVTFFFRPRFRDSFRKVRLKVAKLNAFLQESITGMHVIQLFNNHRKNFQSFMTVNRETRDAHLATVFYFALFIPFVELANALSIVFILGMGGFLLPRDAITIGTLVAFLQYAQRFFRPLRDLSQKYNILQSAVASSERVFKVLDTDSIIPDPETSVKLMEVNGTIEFENVTFAYETGQPVLKNVSFRIEPSERIAVVGATGAGKSTVINLMCRFYEPQEGVIRLDGIPIDRFAKNDLRNYIGLVQQDPFLFSGTLEDNIRLGRKNLSSTTIGELFSKIGLDPFLSKLPAGLKEHVGERGNRFSAGERQLISFVRALSFDPPILILDEATSNVDTDTENLIQEATDRISRNRTAIIIAHRLSTIRHADRILVFHKGQLRETGSHQQLLERKGIYFKLNQIFFTVSS